MGLLRIAFVAMVLSASWTIENAPCAEGTAPPPAAGIHPRIVLTPSELSLLRQKISAAPAAQHYLRSVSAAKDLLNDKSAAGVALTKLRSKIAPTPADHEALAASIREAAFVALVDPANAAIVQAGISALQLFIRGPVPSDFGRTVMHIGLAYDWLFNSMSATFRNEVRAWLVVVLNEYESKLAGAQYGFAPGGIRDDNWTPFIVGAFGVAALAIEGEPGYDRNWYDQASASLMDFLRDGISPLGVSSETTVQYFAYGMSQGTYLLDAMARRGVSVWSHPRLLKVTTWLAHDLLPWGGMFNSLSDKGGTNEGFGEIYYRLAMADPSPVTQWIYETFVSNPNAQFALECSGSLWSRPLSTARAALAPAQLNLPLNGYFPEQGLMYMRTGWGPNDTYLQFQSNPSFAGESHAHADRNGFTLMSKGRMWAIDSGYHISAGVNHNLVTIDGISEGHFPQRGRIVQQVNGSGNWASTIVGDAKAAYDWKVVRKGTPGAQLVQGLLSSPFNPVQYAYRSATLVRGRRSYVMIADHIRKDAAIHDYVWQMLTPIGNTVQNLGNGALLIRPEHSGAYLKGIPGATQEPLRGSFKIKKDGRYRILAMTGKPYLGGWNWGGIFALDGASGTRFLLSAGEKSRRRWQDIGSGVVEFHAGEEHDFVIRPAVGQFEISEVMIAPENYDPNYVGPLRTTISQPLETIRVPLVDSAQVPKGWQYVGPDVHEPRLWVLALSTSPGVWVDAKRFVRVNLDGKPDPTFDSVRITAGVKTAKDPQFRVVLYPHNAGDSMPQVEHSATSLVLRWPDGTKDTWNFTGTTNAAFTLTRQNFGSTMPQTLTVSPAQ